MRALLSFLMAIAIVVSGIAIYSGIVWCLHNWGTTATGCLGGFLLLWAFMYGYLAVDAQVEEALADLERRDPGGLLR